MTQAELVADHLRKCAEAIEKNEVKVSEFSIDASEVSYGFSITMSETNPLH